LWGLSADGGGEESGGGEGKGKEPSNGVHE
jgi:hypothetical protein